jgi:DNA-directed RNA polymerase specialized sigma24 family protein
VARSVEPLLTPESFEHLLTWLDPARERAGVKYEDVRRALIRFFERHGSARADELADETINRVARRIADGELVRSPDAYAYFHGVARNVYLESVKHQAIERKVTVLHTGGVPRRTLGSLANCLDESLHALSAEGRELLESYYRDGCVKLAARLQISPNAVRIRVCREKQRLRAEMDRHLQGHPK